MRIIRVTGSGHLRLMPDETRLEDSVTVVWSIGRGDGTGNG